MRKFKSIYLFSRSDIRHFKFLSIARLHFSFIFHSFSITCIICLFDWLFLIVYLANVFLFTWQSNTNLFNITYCMHNKCNLWNPSTWTGRQQSQIGLGRAWNDFQIVYEKEEKNPCKIIPFDFQHVSEYVVLKVFPFIMKAFAKSSCMQ